MMPGHPNQAMFQRQPHPQAAPVAPPQFMQQPQGPMPGPRGPPQPHQMQMPPGTPPHGMRYGPPGAMAGPPQQRPPGPPVAMQPQPARPPMPRPMFHGHDAGTKLPSDLCLLGCIFFLCDYQDDPEDSKYCDDWKKVIRQFGGEVVDTYHAGITHVLCK